MKSAPSCGRTPRSWNSAGDASTLEIWGPLLNGGRLVIAPAGRLSLGELGALIKERGISTLWLTAALFNQMVDTQLESLRGVRQLLAGGEALSSYPARCVVGIERRTLPGESEADVAAELEALLEACRAEDPALVASQRTLLARGPFEIDPDAPFVRLVADAVTQVVGAPPAIEGAGYWADAAFISAAGIPTVMYGPSGEGAHALEEWVSVSDTVRVTQVLVEVASRVCG